VIRVLIKRAVFVGVSESGGKDSLPRSQLLRALSPVCSGWQKGLLWPYHDAVSPGATVSANADALKSSPVDRAEHMRKVVWLALILASCGGSPTSPDHVLATASGTWQASALGGQFTLTLNQGALDSSTHQAPINGNGSFTQSGNTVPFTVGGFLSLSPGQGDSQLRNIALEWMMPYLRASDRQFHFGGGLEEVTAAGSRMVGFLNSPERGAPCPPRPVPCSPNPNPPDPTVNVQVTFAKP